jgi:gliding motility-associated-like protein
VYLLTILSRFLRRGRAAIIPAVLLVIFAIPASYAQSTSNRGSEFWIAFPTHQPDINDTTYQDILAKISVFITGPQASSGVVSVGNFSKAFSITANTVTEIQIPRDNAYINENEKSTVLSGRAIHVNVNADQPEVVVYAHIFAGYRSAASLILPVEALGQQYYSMNYNYFNYEGQNFITLVATEDNTRIFIKKNNIELIPGGVLLPHAGDVYEYLAYEDLTGAYIHTDGTSPTCGRFAVFSGSSGVNIPYPGCTATTLDPLYQQCYPIESWGNTYGYIPFSKQSSTQTYQVRTAGQMVRVVARDDGTVVKFNGVVVANLNSGEFYSTPKPLKDPTYIEASKPVSAAQFALSQYCSNWPDFPVNGTLGDPDMVILNPVSFSIRDITIFASNRENIKEQFVNILIKTDDAPSFRINGAIPAKPFEPFTGMPGFSFVQLPLSRQTGGSFHLNAAGGFNAIAYGFGFAESYSYSAGTSLAATEKVTGYSETLQKEIDSACVDADFYFRLTLPYRSPKVSWQLDAQEQPTVQLNPPAIEVTENDRVSYVYKFPKSAAYAQPGEHKVKIIADYGAANCSGSSQEINYIFTSLALPVPAFQSTILACTNNYRFTNQSTGQGGLQYEWNFGDPNSSAANLSAEKNPVHTFSANGNFHVTLTVKSPFGCPVIKTNDIIITNFAPSRPTNSGACAGTTITFNDISNSGVFTPVKWRWDFGDGSQLLETSTKTAQHTYQAGGNFKVHLTLVNAQGCTSDASEKTLTVNAEIIADFSFPESCSLDPFTSFSTSASTSANDALTYQWNFGDDQSPVNQSTDKDPKHHFSGPGSYEVTLLVISDKGCTKTITKTVLISAPPKAAFDLMISGAGICGTHLIIKNKTVATGTGTVTKLEVYFDALGQPNQKMEINSPQPGQLIEFDYPALSGNISGTHLIRMIAYSGGSCTDKVEQTVTQFPAPLVDFPMVQPICITSQSFQLIATEHNGLAGSGKYSGPGVTEDGLFSPAAAGTGSHEIKFEFTTTEGCTDFKTRRINVLPEPTVSDQTFTNAGNRPIKLQPIYQGNGLSYHWEPSTGLDNPDIAFPISSATEKTAYRVTITNGACSDVATILLEIAQIPVIRNTFTPNGDGKNDLWEIDNLEPYPNVITDVFNRYGAVVFHTTGPGKYWDGKYKGQNVPAGTYYYTINLGNGQKAFSGYVTVLR